MYTTFTICNGSFCGYKICRFRGLTIELEHLQILISVGGFKTLINTKGPLYRTVQCCPQGPKLFPFLRRCGFHAHYCSVTKSCPPVCDPMEYSTPDSSVLHYLPEYAQTRVHWVSDAIQPSNSLSRPFLLPSVFPSIWGFSNKSTLHIRWPKYKVTKLQWSQQYDNGTHEKYT